ncbi:hypothetical protein M5K25_002467 [Dendrobium thyrsiflorum]|uniref:DUF4283 domain-containing protein n=1 Tax=Dendrobium thyrsiflorum TaxID=117978 RepID=A0ABD0VN99_DENTH
MEAGPSSSIPDAWDLRHQLLYRKTTVRGFPALLMSDDDILKLASPFQFTLVGKFLVRRPNLDAIRNFLGKLKLSGIFSIGLLDARHVSIQLSNDLDYSRIFARRSYYILNCQMRLLKWTPFFDVIEESPIISFPNLRLHFFNAHVLHALGSIFGRPLKTDQATASRSRPSVARILVEVDITKKHPKEVWLGSENSGYLQKVEFENVPDFCMHCKIHGHSINDCFVAHPQLRKNNMTSKAVVGPINGEPVVLGGQKPLNVKESEAFGDDIEKETLHLVNQGNEEHIRDQVIQENCESGSEHNIENIQVNEEDIVKEMEEGEVGPLDSSISKGCLKDSIIHSTSSPNKRAKNIEEGFIVFSKKKGKNKNLTPGITSRVTRAANQFVND